MVEKNQIYVKNIYLGVAYIAGGFVVIISIEYQISALIFRPAT
jgi:hypothetical protein